MIGTDGGALTSLDGKVVITIPPTALEDEFVFTYTPQPEPSYPGPSLDFAGICFQLDAEDGLGAPVASFEVPVLVTVHYMDADVAAIPESTLRLWVWDEASTTWLGAATTCDPEAACVRDLEANTFSTNICHLSEFAVFGQSQKLFLPLVQR